MASRFTQQKPDPAIQRHIISARRRSPRGGKAQTFVVATSLAATLLGWALVAHDDAQTAAALAATTPAATMSTQQSPSTADIPLISGMAQLWASTWNAVSSASTQGR